MINKNTYGKNFITHNVSGFWSNLSAPDIKFGNPNHSVTVEVDPQLNKVLLAAMTELGGTKINALKDYEGKKLIKFKNTVVAKSGTQVFPVTGADLVATNVIPFRSDLVRVKVTPVLLQRDNSVSFYMSEIQLIERRYQENDSVSFSKVTE